MIDTQKDNGYVSDKIFSMELSAEDLIERETALQDYHIWKDIKKFDDVKSEILWAEETSE